MAGCRANPLRYAPSRTQAANPRNLRSANFDGDSQDQRLAASPVSLEPSETHPEAKRKHERGEEAWADW